MPQQWNISLVQQVLCIKIHESGTREVGHVVEPESLPITGHSTAGELHLLANDIDRVENKLVSEFGVQTLPPCVRQTLARFDSSSPTFLRDYRVSALAEDIYWRLIACQVITV